MPTPDSRTTRLRTEARSPGGLLVGTIAVIILAGLVALLVLLWQDEEPGAPVDAFDTAPSTVEGTPLAPLAESGDDPSVGGAAPVIRGTGTDGATLAAPAPERPTVLLFVAHWCPHCQAELADVQDWVDGGLASAGVDVVAISTAIREDQPNYPPSAWLDRAGWTVPTIADANGGAAMAYGVSALPFWVAVDADGTVVERRAGRLSQAEITELAFVAAAS